VLHAAAENDPDVQHNMSVFLKGLRELGWRRGDNLEIDYRWGAGNPEYIQRHAAELIALAPDLILASGNAVMAPVSRATRSIPIVFVNVADPVGAGFVDSLSRPGGNATGFMQFEYSLAAKWMEMLKQIAPSTTRAAVVRDPEIAVGIGQFAVIQSVAPTLGIEVSPVSVLDVGEIERSIAAFARVGTGGLITTASALAAVHRKRIIELAAQYKLPAIYFRRNFTDDGGLISYGIDLADQNRLAAGYVDRILKGEKPADLPVQVPTKYELVINLKTARVLGITMPPSLLVRADEVIE
jgi:putative ABC transport system substrate-binding protein